MLSTDELAQLRALQEEAMPEAVVIHRKTLADDGHGAFEETDTVVATVIGRLGMPGRAPDETMLAAKVNSGQAYTITLPAGVDVQQADELVISTQNDRTFTVVGVLARSFETARKVVCEEKT